MKEGIERDLGEQPLALIIKELELRSHDIVTASPVQITHKMITRAVKGRRLTSHIKVKILNALNIAADKKFKMKDIFNY